MDNVYHNQSIAIENRVIFTAQVYGWMTLGIILTALVAGLITFFGLRSESFLVIAAVSSFPAIIIQLILVLILSFLWQKLNGFIASILFVTYSLFTGITVGVIAINYSLSSIFMAFGISALMFMILSIYGLTTKKDLSKWGAVAFFALIGIILVSIINFVLLLINSPLFNTLNIIVNYAIVIVFSVLIASDSNQLKKLANQAELSGKGYTRYAISGALMLYLDFINLFLSVLRITGSRR